MSAQLLADKLVDLITLCRKWGCRKSYKPRATVTCKKLHRAWFVIPCGHTFLHHLIDLLKGGKGGGAAFSTFCGSSRKSLKTTGRKTSLHEIQSVVTQEFHGFRKRESEEGELEHSRVYSRLCHYLFYISK